MSLTPSECSDAIQYLRQVLPGLQAVYLFGSQANGSSRLDSDVDLAVLLPRPLEAERRWEVAQTLASRLGRDVDLVDLRGASTVMQHQVLSHGGPVWSAGSVADEYELSVFSEYWDLTIQRRELVDDIKQRGRVHGR
ncbi:nucleotidyltransferase domain-containing protein [Halomonas almeriensis]|uniref:type VII toxin-antitoxin system MntA family adenylyltransferase antitoxin n=1 Tax=Halomonas almeriensis TaxID=308163 RepID=UPI0025B56E05|nr:nucleotidyltransferase domain-containing protein [Halomonas almeriensis]MDN3554223.1 nucleotidyltransferase domain-containing protein [Halomonas almeriensis]